MALSYTRLLCKRSFNLQNFRCLYTSNPSSIYTSVPALSSCPTTVETHDEKNMRLKRPMSPHLTIYKLQLTSLLSVTHRGTGVVLSSYVMFLGLGTLFIPGGIPCVIEAIEAWCLPSTLLLLGKAAFVYPLTFHYFNGLRHLSWDLGKFLTIKEVYSTGWTVVTLAAIASVILAAM